MRLTHSKFGVKTSGGTYSFPVTFPSTETPLFKIQAQATLLQINMEPTKLPQTIGSFLYKSCVGFNVHLQESIGVCRGTFVGHL